MSRRITRSQTICLANAQEYLQNKCKSEPPRVERRLTRRSALNELANISTPTFKEISNDTKVKPTTQKAKKNNPVDKTLEVNSVKPCTTPLSTKVDNASFTSNPKNVAQRRMSVVTRKQEATTIKSLSTTSSKDDHELVPTVVSKKNVKTPEKVLTSTTKKSYPTTSSAKGDKAEHQDPSNLTGYTEKRVVKNALRSKSVPSETPSVLVEKTLANIAKQQNPKTSSNEAGHGDASSTVVSDKKVTAARSLSVFKTPSIPLRRSERIKKGSTPESYKIPSITQPAKIKARRYTVHSFQREVPDVIVKNPPTVKNNSKITKAAARSACNPKNVKIIVNEGSTSQINGDKANNATPDDPDIIVNNPPTASNCTIMKSPARKAVNTKKDGNIVKGGSKGVKTNDVILASYDRGAIKIPDDLKTVLQHDSYIVNGQKQLYNIPTKLNVAKVIDDYTATIRLDEAHGSSGITIEKMFDAIIEYFEVLIGTQLLYELENVQYVDILHKHPGIAMSKVYPPVYLLRLLVRLNKLLPYSKTDSESLQWILDQLDDFAKYLSEHKAVLFDLNSLC